MAQEQKQPRLWGDKRYHTFNWHLRQTFGGKVFKVALDGGFTCPNRDGTFGDAGCIYCSGRGSGDFAGQAGTSLHEQFVQGRAMMQKKWPRAQYIAYFQAFSNTYAPLDRLKQVYEAGLAESGVVGLAIATRPDCLSPEVVDYLAELSRRTYLWLELGLQTIHRRTLDWIGRGHDEDQFLQAVQRLQRRDIRICAHLILGLPGESREDMLASAAAVAALPVQGVKYHLLHVLRGTRLAEEFLRRPFELLSREDYISLVTDILEITPPDKIILRLTGDGAPNDLLAPVWSRKKWEVLNAIDAELIRRNAWQGCRGRRSIDKEME